MTRTIIIQTDKFTVVSYGNGTSYLFINKAQFRECAFQGDDAVQFMADLEAHENARPNASTNKIMAYLWADYDLASEPCGQAQHSTRDQ